MGQFDQTARQASKADGGPLLAWVFRHLAPAPPWEFERWDDTRRLVSPGEPDRTNDLVAVLRRTDAPERRGHAVIEIETEPERFIFHRLGAYGLQLAMEVAAASETDSPPEIVTILLNLTGKQNPPSLALPCSGTQAGIWVQPIVIDVAGDDARVTLADIAAGKTGLCILPWVPLMAGGGDPALIEEWKRVASLEQDPWRRVAYRDLALVFAELIKAQVNWLRALEGWEMQESQYILKWENRGEEKGELRRSRFYLLKLIRGKLQDPVPESIRLAIEGTNDKGTLDRWFDVAIQVSTLAELRAAMNLEP